MGIKAKVWNAMSTAILLASITLILSGCSTQNDEIVGDEEPKISNDNGEGQDHGNNSSDPDLGNGSSGRPDDSNSSQVHDPGWPVLNDATIRPGGLIDGSCTTNFIFRSPDNLTLFVGTAAHCLEDEDRGFEDSNGCEENVSLPLGSKIDLEGADYQGILVYSSKATMFRVGESNDDACKGNDFALVEIDQRDRSKVHPATQTFGGPIGLMTIDPQENEQVYSHGRSRYHADQRELERREGYIQGMTNNNWTIFSLFASPAIPGDSGSPVIHESGYAMAAMTTIDLVHASNGMVNLKKALDYMNEHTDLEVELATWRTVEEGALPEWPL